MNYREFIAPVAQTTTVVVAFCSVVAWGIWLEVRISRLEAQFQAIATSSPGQVNGPAGAFDQACANLALRAADAYGKGTRNGDSEGATLEGLIGRIGCPKK